MCLKLNRVLCVSRRIGVLVSWNSLRLSMLKGRNLMGLDSCQADLRASYVSGGVKALRTTGASDAAWKSGVKNPTHDGSDLEEMD
jgi:hypothetical protein